MDDAPCPCGLCWGRPRGLERRAAGEGKQERTPGRGGSKGPKSYEASLCSPGLGCPSSKWGHRVLPLKEHEGRWAEGPGGTDAPAVRRPVSGSWPPGSAGSASWPQFFQSRSLR